MSLLAIVAFPLAGVLTFPEALAGFADPSVILIAALFVVGEGLSRTGVTYRVGDWLVKHSKSNPRRLLVLLMLTVAALGAVMSSTGVVAIFIPVVLSLAARMGISPRMLMMPLSMAALTSGMLTLIATAPNLIVDAELQRQGAGGFDFFSVTPFGLVILLLGIGYMLVVQRFLGGDETEGLGSGRDSFNDLLTRYEIESRTSRFRIGARSPLIGSAVAGIQFEDAPTFVLGVERKRFWQGTALLTEPDTVLKRGDTLILDLAPEGSKLVQLGLKYVGDSDRVFDDHARQLGMVEVVIPPDSRMVGQSVSELRFRSDHGVTVLGVRQAGRVVKGDPAYQRLRAGAVLLLACDWDAIRRLGEVTGDFLSMAPPRESDESAPAASRAPFALFSLALMVPLLLPFQP
ncbi:SLC13 family permease [Gulosibacter chungangensis]|uniref:SLC13 family permease n=1 Tax=Gulosibacter chungangensis TaxID=979746 RepID=UPI0017884697|nr:SLC13 family permease [Gulosibacter chungangensis]